MSDIQTFVEQHERLIASVEHLGKSAAFLEPPAPGVIAPIVQHAVLAEREVIRLGRENAELREAVKALLKNRPWAVLADLRKLVEPSEEKPE